MQTRIRAVAAGLWVAACGPLPPATDTTGGETSTGTTTTTGDPSTGGPTGPTTEPTSGTSGTSGTTGPVPECFSDAECGDYCSYCIDGECHEEVGCCGLVPGPGGELELRCIGYECYDDEECDDGEFCDAFGAGGFCTPLAPIPVCERQTLMLSEIPLQDLPSAIALADLDGDARLDLIAVLPDAGLVEVALGDGAGGFAASATFPTGLSAGVQRVAVADFDGDGSADLAVTSSTALPDGELSLLFGQDAVFAAPVMETIGQQPKQVWAGDVDGDGRADLLTHDGADTGSVTLRLGDGMGGFGVETSEFDANDAQFAVGVGAVVGDDRVDVVTTTTDQPGARVLQYEAGVFQTVATASGAGSTLHQAVAVGDVDGDGVDDIVGHRAANAGELIQAWPMLAAMPEFVVEGEVQLGPVADVDGDGRGDLVTAGSGATARVIFLDAPCVQTYALPDATAAPLLAAGDLDGDGKHDIVAGAVIGAALSILRSGP